MASPPISLVSIEVNSLTVTSDCSCLVVIHNVPAVMTHCALCDFTEVGDSIRVGRKLHGEGDSIINNNFLA